LREATRLRRLIRADIEDLIMFEHLKLKLQVWGVKPVPWYGQLTTVEESDRRVILNLCCFLSEDPKNAAKELNYLRPTKVAWLE